MDCTARWGAIMGVGLLYRIDSLRPDSLTNFENSEASSSPVPAGRSYCQFHLSSQTAKAVQTCVIKASSKPCNLICIECQ